jgi:gamma-glutamylcyclotransferase (GGCT)/AIG2-like uncharacterized protein YtfP
LILFTYGTLKQGYWNHHLLGDSLYLGKGVTYDKYALYDITYPLAVSEEIENSNHVAPVNGELYHVTREVLDVVDELEILYERRARPIISELRGIVNAFIYEFPVSSPFGLNTLCPIVDGAYEWKG